MSRESEPRRVTLRRTGPGAFEIVNERGGTLPIGVGDGPDFTPVELLLGAVGGCSSIDVDILTTRRAEPEAFDVDVSGVKIRDEGGNQLDDIEVRFRIRFPAGSAGDAARAILPRAVERSHDQLCTVSRTIELGAPVTMSCHDA